MAEANSTCKRPNCETPSCSVDNCGKAAKTRGWCAKHYARWRAHGDPLYTKRHLKVSKPCMWCGETMSLKPGQARKRECCSVSCANYLKASRAGLSVRLKAIWCLGCHKLTERTVRSERDAGKYCSRECAEKLRALISEEKAALRRIGDRRRDKERERYNSLVRPEVQALRRIAARCNAPGKIIICPHCGIEARRKRPFFRFCSLECKRESDKVRRLEYRQTDAYKAMKRAAKSRRRALLSTATADSIDPFKVFERDQWKCHLCGCKTLKSKRGTTHDRAPELEHIISLAEGGTHTWGNVACACRKCNMTKGASSAGQLGLQIAC